MKETWIKMESWMKVELLLVIIFMISGAITINIINKLQGMLFTLSTISVLMMIVKASGLLLPMVRNISMSNKYLFIIILSVIDSVLLLLYGHIDNKLWLYSVILIDVPFGIIMSAFFIDYDGILKELTSTKMFTEMQYMERMIFSAVGILGGGLTYILSNILSIDKIILVIVTIKIIGNIISIYQYKTTYRYINIKQEKDEDKEIESDIYLNMTLEDYLKNK